MGLRFRKSKKIGPFRVNLSKSGVGYSYGNKYARVTHTADGRKRTTLTAPSTGLSYVHTEGKQSNRQSQQYQEPAREKKRSGCLPWALIAVVILFFAGLGNGKTDKIDINSDPKISTVETVAEPTKQIQFRPVSAEAEKTESTTQPVTKATTEATVPTTEATTQPTTAATTAPEEQQFIVNKNTKKFHHVWCGSAPAKDSKSYWLTDATKENLERIGYTPCKICFLSEPVPVNSAAEQTKQIETIASAPVKYEKTFICFADKTTMIYHNSWCDYAPTIGSSNCYSGMKTASEIESEGYKPCAKCIW